MLRSTDFTSLGGNIYRATFTKGPIWEMFQNGNRLTAAASASVGSGEFYYDRLTNYLYMNVGGSLQSNHAYVPTFYMFSASRDLLWHETPDDASTPVVQWNGTLKQVPEFRIAVQPLALGLMPSEPTTATILNDGSLNEILYGGSFLRTPCEAWHMAGPELVANVEPILYGVLGESIDVNDDSIIFQVLDKAINFEEQSPGSYLTSSNPVDPKFNGQPLMKFWGFGVTGGQQDGKPVFEMMNIDYNQDAPSTSNNRKFVLVADPDARYAEIVVAGTLKPGGAAWFSPTNPDDVYKFGPDDRVWFDGAADQYFSVDGTNSGRVEFNEAITGGNNQAGNLRVSFVRIVYFIKNGIAHFPKYGRDYEETLHTEGRGITLKSGCEANLGIATFDPATDSIWAYVVGQKTFPQNNGVDVVDAVHAGESFQFNANFWHGINVLYSYLKDECGLTEDQIDFDSFTAAKPAAWWGTFLPLPFSQQAEFPKQREVLDVILRTLLLRAWYAPDGRFTVSAYKPPSSVDATITKEELLETSYRIDYSQMAKVEFRAIWNSSSLNRIVPTGDKDSILAGTAEVKIVQGKSVNQVNNAESSFEGTWLHKVKKSILIEHCLTHPGWTDFEDRCQDLYGERTGRLKVKTAQQNRDRAPGDPVEVQRQNLVGFSVDGTDQSNDFEVLELNKQQEDVELELDDLKAAKDKTSESYWFYI